VKRDGVDFLATACYKPKEITDELRRKGVIVSARANGIRVSPHFYNTEEEIDRLVEEVKRQSCKV
jgi:selenocysteine lyase/cysteine desulfurase